MRFWGFFRSARRHRARPDHRGRRGPVRAQPFTVWWSSVNPSPPKRPIAPVRRCCGRSTTSASSIPRTPTTRRWSTWRTTRTTCRRGVSGGRVIYVGKGDVDAVVDFGRLDQSNVVVSPDRQSVAVTLPLAPHRRAGPRPEDQLRGRPQRGLRLAVPGLRPGGTSAAKGRRADASCRPG